MDKVKITLPLGKKITVDKGTKIYDVVKNYITDIKYPILFGELNGKPHDLGYELCEDGILSIEDSSNSIGNAVYARTLQFIFIKAVNDLFPDAKVTIEHSIHRGLTGEIHKTETLNLDEIPLISERMQQIIDADIPINKICIDKEKAIEIFKGYKMEDKVRFLSRFDADKVNLYEINGLYDYFYGPMAYSTGAIYLFKLDYYDPGFLLRFPLDKDPDRIPNFVDYKKLGRIFNETEQWCDILDVGDVGALNEKVQNGEIVNIIRVNEALHEKKIANIADMIKDRYKVKIVLIAGPSSSGKTTFAKRLGIQLRVNGLIPIPISLDDYFVERGFTPKDENGDFDFESIYALDLKLFNQNLTDLLTGNEVELPTYNFKLGKREWSGEKFSIPENGVLVVEGIHGLNEQLTSSIPKENKFKIYISALTQLNIDSHNRIPTTDIRIIRRIVRDYLSRGYGAEDTLKMWPSIRRGEERNIFVYQEEADVMFNSNLVYELCVLKKYALLELNKIDEKSPIYFEAWRLRSFLHYFKEVEKEMVPENSILREFTGGSCFYKY